MHQRNIHARHGVYTGPMAKHIRIVACSAEGAALCYRTLCNEAQARMGEHMHPEVSMHTTPLGSICRISIQERLLHEPFAVDNEGNWTPKQFRFCV